MSEKALTNKQAAFVREYLKDSNGAQAAIRAGYSPKRADAIAYENLRKPEIAKVLTEAQAAIAKKTETEAEWVRRRLKEEADDFSEFASHSARIRALELVGKINGVFELDNKQQASGAADFLKALKTSILGVVQGNEVAQDDE
jgi:phage terminase small subunit